MRFLTQGFLSKDRFDSLASMNEPQPKLTFFRFLAANPKTHQPVFIAQRLIGLDAICCHRARRPHQLLYILDIRDRPRKPTPKKSPPAQRTTPSVPRDPRPFNHQLSLAFGALGFGILACFLSRRE